MGAADGCNAPRRRSRTSTGCCPTRRRCCGTGGEDSNALTRRATRPDWLLDGWQIICELWRESDTTMRANTLWEMALLAPILPREVEDWFGIEEDWDRPTRMRRVVRANEDWRSGRMLDIIARNERLRARMA